MKNPLVETKAMTTKLSNPPLERVLAAAAFTPVLKIADTSGAGIADFQDRMRALYPIVELNQEEEVYVELGADGKLLTPVIRKKPIWRMLNLEKTWRMSLTSDSISLETQRAYEGRDHFVAAFVAVCEAVEEAFRPAQMTRIGVRYLNVFGAEKMKRFPEFVRPDFYAFGCSPYIDHLSHSNSVAEFDVPEGTLMLKYGVLAPSMQHEFMLAPVPEQRWFFDVDAWCVPAAPFIGETVLEHANALTRRTGTLFNWAITPEFVEAYDDNR